MKTTYPKFKIHFTTYLIFLIFLLTGYIKNIIIIFLIIIIHELGHITFLKIFEVPITKIELYPFGGLTTSDLPINYPINKELLIYSSGVLFQLILGLIIYVIYKYHLINTNTYNLFTLYNKVIILFNLLPIKPLDGLEILILILFKKFPYVKIINFSFKISITTLILLILYSLKINITNYFVITYLLYKTIDFKKKIPFYKNRFFLERYLKTFPYQRIEHNKEQNLNLLKKDTLHFFKNGDKYIHERELLKLKFDNNS